MHGTPTFITENIESLRNHWKDRKYPNKSLYILLQLFLHGNTLGKRCLHHRYNRNQTILIGNLDTDHGEVYSNLYYEDIMLCIQNIGPS
jgi:hypothetical protein